MDLDDTICWCFHVPARKLVHFARRPRPARPSLMTECLGAGTGCGWCIPLLAEIARDPDAFQLDQINVEQYVSRREAYITQSRPKNVFDNAGD